MMNRLKPVQFHVFSSTLIKVVNLPFGVLLRFGQHRPAQHQLFPFGFEYGKRSLLREEQHIKPSPRLRSHEADRTGRPPRRIARQMGRLRDIDHKLSAPRDADTIFDHKCLDPMHSLVERGLGTAAS